MVVAVEGILQGEAICDFELFPNDNPARAKLPFLDFELARSQVEHFVQRSEDARKQPHLRPRIKATIGRPIAAINERVLLSRMAVQVAEE